MNVIVMGGLGEVGAALCEVLNKNGNIIYVLDKKDDFRPPEGRKYEFLHVTIPFSDSFHSAVRSAIRDYDPRYVVIHSTVPVGTTRKLGNFCAHSPVRGQHPNLAAGIRKFVKYVGAHKDETRYAVVDHLESVGLTAEGWSKPEDTELMKMLCLSRYLNDLAFYEAGFRTCKKFSVAPIRMVHWTNSYNDGYRGTKYVRPELSFPMGKVGGHCVMPVSKMLFNQTGYKYFKKNLEVFR